MPERLGSTGVLTFPPTGQSIRWARAAARHAAKIDPNAAAVRGQLRHDGTWFVGLDALPNAPDGRLDDVPLDGPWQRHLPPAKPLHPAQVSIVFPGYPGRDAGESDAAHRFRRVHSAAHVDGLLPVGPDRRRYARELHAYVLGLQISAVCDAPTVCWPGSHRIIGAALRRAIGDNPVGDVDVTQAYVDARRQVLQSIRPVKLRGAPGFAFLLHRFMLHGTAPWESGQNSAPRMVAFFRPDIANPQEWLCDC